MTTVVTLSRYWGSQSSDVHRLAQFVECATRITRAVVIAVNVDHDQSGAVQHIQQRFGQNQHVHVLPISPWGGVTHALNLLVHYVAHAFPSVPFVLFWSPEVSVCPAVIKKLISILEDDKCALVVGSALPGHQVPVSDGCGEQKWSRREIDIGGTTVPWNTLAMWRISSLRRTGFLQTAELVTPSGMEEVTVVALQQRLFGPSNAKAFLVFELCTIGSGRNIGTSDDRVKWNTDFNDKERRELHEVKMLSKCARTDTILQCLGISPKDVIVTVVCFDNHRIDPERQPIVLHLDKLNKKLSWG